MDWMIENWYIVIALICIGACAGFAIQRFVNTYKRANIKDKRVATLCGVRS